MKDSLQAAATERLALSIASWLPCPDPSSNLMAAQSKRQQDTGKWLLESPVFLDWKTADFSFLWLHGKAGSGKSVLISTVIHSLFDAAASNSRVIYYYFDFQDQEKQLVCNMLRYIIIQLSIQIKETTRVVEGLYNSYSARSTMPTLAELKDIMRRMIENAATTPAIYLVVDALDECKERKSLLEVWEELRSWDQTILHVFATSRRETDIEDSLGKIATHVISLEESVVDGDILTYIGHQLQNDTTLCKWSEEIRKEIETALMKGANGMFRWVECQLDAIRGCMKPALLRKTLKSLPKTLDDTYARILTNVAEDYIEDVHRILSCLVCCLYPLAVHELAETVAIVPQGDTCFDVDNRLREPRDVLSLCSGLVTTVKSRRTTLMGGPQIPIEEVRLAHFSVKEYLVSDRISSKPTSDFHIEERMAHELLATLSIRYLIHCHQEKYCESSEFLMNYETDFLKIAAFAPYAASFWSQHLRITRVESTSEIYNECLRIFTDPAFLKDAISLRRPWFRYEEVSIMQQCGYIQTYGGNHRYNPDFEPVPPLHYAALLGLENLVLLLLNTGENVNCSTSAGTCLVAAVSNGHHSIVELLIAKGADVNALTLQTSEEEYICYSKTAIHEAVSNRNETIVKLLIAADADVNIERSPSGLYHRGDSANTPLQAAVYKNDEKLVKIMLDTGADPNARPGHLGTALEYASYHDHDIMNMLLDAGANPNLMSDPEGALSPLFNTLVHDNLPGTRSLVSRGVDPQTIDHRIIPAIIHNAILNKTKFEATVEALIQIRLDIDRGHLFMAAAKYGHAGAMEKMLQNGTSPDTQEENGLAAIHAAAFTPGCDTEAFQILLDGKAVIDIEGGPLGSALQAAALSGKLQIVKLILDKSNRLNHTAGLYGSALKIARDRLKDQQMDCPEYWTWKPAIGIQSYGAPEGYPSGNDYLQVRHSVCQSPKDATYEAKINIAHLPNADYQSIIDVLLSHGAEDV